MFCFFLSLSLYVLYTNQWIKSILLYKFFNLFLI
nr:MAG TPA: hypothetical protein [Caudoviricetes sp.]